MLNRVEYEAALTKLHKSKRRIAVKQMNDYLIKEGVFTDTSAVIKWLIKEQAIWDEKNAEYAAIKPKKRKGKLRMEEKFVGFGTYRKLVNDVQYRKFKAQVDDSDNHIWYLLFFYDKLGVWLACKNGEVDTEKSADSVAAVVFTPKGPAYDDVIYDVFYWRTNTDEVGVAKIRFNTDWKQADLVYHYRTVGIELAFLKGSVERFGENVYVNFRDRDVPERSPSVRSFWSLFISHEVDKRDYIAGVFASSNRNSHEPICGKLILKNKHGESKPYRVKIS